MCFDHLLNNIETFKISNSKKKSTIKPIVIDSNSFEQIINNPEIPYKNKKPIDNENSNIISYLDNDIYDNNEQNYKFNQIASGGSNFVKYTFIIILTILGISIIIYFSKNPKKYWNILVLYIIIIILLKYKFDTNKKFLFFDNFNYLFSKNIYI